MVVVVNGGPNTMRKILNSLTRDVPVLLICESGGSADLVAAIVNKFNGLNSAEKDLFIETSSHKETFFSEFIEMIDKVIIPNYYQTK